MSRRTLRRRPVEPKTRRAERRPQVLRGHAEAIGGDTVQLLQILERVDDEVLSFIVQEAARLLAVGRLLDRTGPKRRRNAARARRSVDLLDAVSEAALAEVRRRMRARLVSQAPNPAVAPRGQAEPPGLGRSAIGEQESENAQ